MPSLPCGQQPNPGGKRMAIVVENLSYIYAAGTPRQVLALSGINFHVPRGAFAAIIGGTGSGKSTLVQHFNGLLRPSQGEVRVFGQPVGPAKAEQLRQLRRRVGLVFQYPEAQLFAETGFADVAFGPRNLGLSEAEVEARVQRAAELVGLARELLERSPFQLSGGQARRLALAGILAMQPELLVVDEPGAGLDPRGRAEMLGLLKRLNRDGLTIVMVSHQMDEVAEVADLVLVLSEGRQLAFGPPREIFAETDLLATAGLEPPLPVLLLSELERRGWPSQGVALTQAEAVASIVAALKQGGEADV